MDSKQRILDALYTILYDLEKQLKTYQIPQIKITSRAKSNLVEREEGFWELGKNKSTVKTLKTKGGAKELLKLVYTVSFLI